MSILLPRPVEIEAGPWTLRRTGFSRKAPERARLFSILAGSRDTAGAWLIDRARQTLDAKGVECEDRSIRPEYEILLREARYRALAVREPPSGSYIIRLFADIGESVVRWTSIVATEVRRLYPAGSPIGG